MTYRLKHVAEYAVLRGVAAVVTVLPYRAALVVAWILALVGFHLVRFRRREAERRIREIFGNRFTNTEVREIAWMSFRNFLFVAIDVMVGPSLTRRQFEARSDYQVLTKVMQSHKETGRSAIIAVPHFGSWEFGGMAMAQTGLPLLVIAGKQRNPLFDRYLTESRRRAGIEIVMRGASTLRKVISRLHEGRFMAVVGDVRMPTPGVKVQFLGREANVGPGMALFARHAGVPIIPAINVRRGWARHEGVVFPAIEPDPTADKNADIQRMTQAVFDVFTNAIRNDPGQWFWYNKRWLFDPVT
jgi:KDO2-lipid IV(A) lauroyltransferase